MKIAWTAVLLNLIPPLEKWTRSNLRWGQRRECPDVRSVSRERTSVNFIFRQTNLMSCKIMYWETGQMRDESTKQAAQEYLAAKLTEEEQAYEAKLNGETAVTRSPLVWKRVKEAIFTQCSEWNAVTQEETLTCKETAIGDLRIWCAARSKQMTVHYDSRKLLITVKNAGRLEHEKDVILRIEGYRTGPDRDDRDARLIRNDLPVNIDMLLLGELRVLTGIGRQRNA